MMGAILTHEDWADLQSESASTPELGVQRRTNFPVFILKKRCCWLQSDLEIQSRRLDSVILLLVTRAGSEALWVQGCA